MEIQLLTKTTFKWKKLVDTSETGSALVLPSNSSVLRFNNLKDEDVGTYECIFINENGLSSAKYELSFVDKQDSNKSDGQIRFNFIQFNLKPGGQIDVICESGNFKFDLNKNELMNNNNMYTTFTFRFTKWIQLVDKKRSNQNYRFGNRRRSTHHSLAKQIRPGQL